MSSVVQSASAHTVMPDSKVLQVCVGLMLTPWTHCAQAEASTIVTAAHQVNAGIVPTLDPILSSQLQVRTPTCNTNTLALAGEAPSSLQLPAVVSRVVFHGRVEFSRPNHH